MTSATPNLKTTIDEVGDHIYRISIAIPPNAIPVPGGFSFNQYLIVDDESLLFHTGGRTFFPLVKAAIEQVMPINRLKYVGFSHYEQDECGALNELLAAAPNALPLCGTINALINGAGMDRPPLALADGEILKIGKKTLKWFDAPHLPHAWDCGYLFEEQTRTLLCGDLFTQPGADNPASTTSDILGPSEAMRAGMDYYAHSPNSFQTLERLASLNPVTLACMHGSAWNGDGAKILHELAKVLSLKNVKRDATDN